MTIGPARRADLRAIHDMGIDMVFLEQAPGSGVVDRVAVLGYGLDANFVPAFLKLFWR